MKFNFRLEDIKYIKLLCKDINDNPCIIKGAIKSANDREILACSKFSEGLNINTPQEVSFSVICNDGLYRTKTILKSIENDEPYAFFALETPNGIEYLQNREYFRVSAKYPCKYIIKEKDLIKDFQTETFDISANGVSIFMPIHIISDTTTKLELLIDNRLIKIDAEYVRSEKIEHGYKMSFSYSKISESDKDFISQVCIKKQLEQRKNAIK